MKKALKTLSLASILIFGILWVSSKFSEDTTWNNGNVRGVLVLIYLVSSNKHYQLEIKDKDDEIAALKKRINEGP